MSPVKQSDPVVESCAENGVKNGAANGTPLALSAGDLVDALGVGTNLLVGRYCVELASGDWWWSDEVYAMHGWKRHEVEPSLQALRSRKHPDDRARMVRAVGDALRAGRPFACGHRIVGRDGRTRSLVVTGQALRNAPAGTREVAGYVVDVTPVQKEALDRRAASVVNHAFVSRAVIEQAKGVVAAVRGVDAGAAEQVLRDAAGEVGVPLRVAADQMTTALRKNEKSGLTPAVLSRALDAIHPVERPHGRDPLLTRRPRSAAR
ncbi:PAS and ANTAR domain-containing protein [Myceligenerans pegani]|uniref:PAS and ANTAR domain-containing protein n=1 Tax=Myceligenerans pegani TaxID=2776917 RepID=A0ABR9MYW7_9MICO|nr:PAS and ANTAR domain-containing protein [Myceligenerans sp. TRM 65318]MBE1876221.1 PAS and ANTAR domain-containing protein [Myceligenerans sp. TRM 65318]MBE3018492.1 PAS and ANTAR domain-containing protein [Myceligenerans sp. TRM 65318]